MDRYSEIIELLTSKGKYYVELGLDRILEVLKLYNNPQEKLKCIQIAGTNGKGSVAAMLDSILIEAGYKTGLYTSPHIFEYTERIKLSGVEISKDDFVYHIQDVVNISDKNNIRLTEFEVLTVAMFNYFYANNVDIVILETGLGGRLDATNVTSKNLCSIITHIDLDHTDRLGNTKDKIAFEKAGIIKPNCPVITSEGYEPIKDRADELNSLFILTTPFVKPKFMNALSLRGSNQQENLALVLQAINHLFKDIDDETIVKALTKVNHICRFQYIKEKNMIIDGCHNPNGIESLVQNLDLYYPNTKRQFIFGCLKNKDYKKMLSKLFSFEQYEDTPPKIYFYTFDSINACPFETLHEECIYFSRKLKSIDDIQLSDDILTVICGSFYMLNELIPKDWVL